MKWPSILKRPLRLFKKSGTSKPERNAAIQYRVTLPLPHDGPVPVRSITKAILESPWSTPQTPVITFPSEGESVLVISFGVLNKEKGRLIEQQIRSLLFPGPVPQSEESKNHE